MLNFFYTLFIFPIEQIIELSYVLIFKIFKDPGISVLGVSFIVSILTLPLYLMAEKHQRSEKDIQKKMRPDINNIKTVFSGNERFMRLSTYYRQKNYHPLYSLRSSISILIQIPFFIAAYNFLSNLEIIKGISFGSIIDLAKPDSLYSIKNISINILPIIMTLINCLSTIIYSNCFSKREKIQLYGMAVIFLILLYNSPSCLVLYWTGNNLFSLIKNIIQKTEYPKTIIFALIWILTIFLDIYLLLIHNDYVLKRIILASIITFISFFPIFYSFYTNKSKIIYKYTNNFNQIFTNNIIIFILSITLLFILIGLVIPSTLIASSVLEFSFIGKYDNPFHFIINSIIKSLGVFILWPISIYLIFSHKIKKILTYFCFLLSYISLINLFLFPGNYGILSIMFTFSENIISTKIYYLLNLLVLFFTFLLIIFIICKFNKIIIPFLSLTICGLILFSSFNCYKINKEFKIAYSQNKINKTTSYEYVYQFSKTGKNVLIIMLDRGINGFIPYIFDEKPDLNNSYDGFTWYNNTVSFGEVTNFGSPGIFGGYEYTPLEMQTREDIPLIEKHNEALLMLPRIFLDNDFQVTVTEPPWANYSWIPDLSIYKNYPQIRAENIYGKYNNNFLLNSKNNIMLVDPSEIINNNFIRFCLFKIAPVLFRKYIYDNGKWLYINKIEDQIKFPKHILNYYIALDVLPNITKINENQINTFNIITNDLTHYPIFLKYPEYIPSNELSDKGNGPLSDESHYHVNIAAHLLLAKWFDFLKENDVYNNTRIIIVSDHGGNIKSKFKNNISLPNGAQLEQYAALLMMKDFNSHGKLKIDDTFMTNADVPILALKDIIDSPINPWTGKLIESNKKDGITLTTAIIWDVNKHFKYKFNIKPNEWLHVHDNIYEQSNWSQVIIE